MKSILLLILLSSSFSLFSQYKRKVVEESSSVQHRVYAGSQVPLRVHVGYELQFKRLQVGAFVGFTPKRYQDAVFYVLQKVKNEYIDELEYLKNSSQPKIQFGGEVKLSVGKNISLGLTTQTFNASIRDTPRNITRGILPEESAGIESLLSFSAEVKNAYENKTVEAFMNTIVAGPIVEKIFWLDKTETFFIKAKFAYWVLVTRQNDLKTTDFTPIEQLGVDSSKPTFLNKLDRVSSKLQAPSFGLELGIAF